MNSPAQMNRNAMHSSEHHRLHWLWDEHGHPGHGRWQRRARLLVELCTYVLPLVTPGFLASWEHKAHGPNHDPVIKVPVHPESRASQLPSHAGIRVDKPMEMPPSSARRSLSSGLDSGWDLCTRSSGLSSAGHGPCRSAGAPCYNFTAITRTHSGNHAKSWSLWTLMNWKPWSITPTGPRTCNWHTMPGQRNLPAVSCSTSCPWMTRAATTTPKSVAGRAMWEPPLGNSSSTATQHNIDFNHEHLAIMRMPPLTCVGWLLQGCQLRLTDDGMWKGHPDHDVATPSSLQVEMQ